MKRAMVAILLTSIFAFSSDILEFDNTGAINAETAIEIVCDNNEDIIDGTDLELEQLTLTADTCLYASGSIGGFADTLFRHYGNYKYNSRAYVHNQGNSTLTVEMTGALGNTMAYLKLEPGEDKVLNFYQFGPWWLRIHDGIGRISIQTDDGSDGLLYFRYNVLGR